MSSDGGFALAGYKESINEDDDFFLIKTDAHGIPEFPLWTIIPLLFVTFFLAVFCRQRFVNKEVFW